MDTLPVCKTRAPIDMEEQFYRKNDDSYDELINNIKRYCEGDCWGIVVNDEVLYNKYAYDMSYRERLIQRGFLQQIAEDPHNTLLLNFITSNEDSVLNIYMNNSYNAYMIHIYYNPDHSLFCISKYIK